jgi:sulfhydrogenase subunit gamma (sulfur reductase)
MSDRNIPIEGVVVNRVEESPTIFTLSLRLMDRKDQESRDFLPGQFNMLYLFGVGEIPVSVNIDADEPGLLQHTIRKVGRVTKGFAELQPGDRIGVRGPFGRGWPLDRCEGKDMLIVTGGLGCAPVLPVIKYMMHHRSRFGRITILQGVKHSEDMIWREHYEQWSRLPDTEVRLAADVAGPQWKGLVGKVTGLFDQLDFDFSNSMIMMCGPEPMMLASIRQLRERGVSADDIWLSMERNMQCAVGHCGHCQYGERFICTDGPVFPLTELVHLLGEGGI